MLPNCISQSIRGRPWGASAIQVAHYPYMNRLRRHTAGTHARTHSFPRLNEDIRQGGEVVTEVVTHRDVSRMRIRVGVHLGKLRQTEECELAEPAKI